MVFDGEVGGLSAPKKYQQQTFETRRPLERRLQRDSRETPGDSRELAFDHSQRRVSLSLATKHHEDHSQVGLFVTLAVDVVHPIVEPGSKQNKKMTRSRKWIALHLRYERLRKITQTFTISICQTTG